MNRMKKNYLNQASGLVVSYSPEQGGWPRLLVNPALGGPAWLMVGPALLDPVCFPPTQPLEHSHSVEAAPATNSLCSWPICSYRDSITKK